MPHPIPDIPDIPSWPAADFRYPLGGWIVTIVVKRPMGDVERPFGRK